MHEICFKKKKVLGDAEWEKYKNGDETRLASSQQLLRLENGCVAILYTIFSTFDMSEIFHMKTFLKL